MTSQYPAERGGPHPGVVVAVFTAVILFAAITAYLLAFYLS